MLGLKRYLTAFSLPREALRVEMALARGEIAVGSKDVNPRIAWDNRRADR